MGSLVNGTLPHDAQTQLWAKMYFKEWLTYATFSNNMNQEFKRWLTNGGATIVPTNGWSYAGYAIEEMVTVADVFARLGNYELYDFSTSSGWTYSAPNANASTSGGPKSLLEVVRKFTSFVNQRSTNSPNWQGAANNTNCADARYLIQPQDDIYFGTGAGHHERISDTLIIPGNLYWQDNNIKAAYMRTASGAPSYPAVPEAEAGAYPWSGGSCYPGILFMFGQMEGVVDPYI